MWKHGSLPDCPGKIVIPIELASKKIVKYKVAQIRGAGGSSRYFPSKVELADWFPIEPAFSVTIHKDRLAIPPYLVPVAFMIATCPFTVLPDSSVASGEDDSEDHTLSVGASE